MILQPGHANQLGAVYDGEGTNFAIFSAHASAVELCLYDPTGLELQHRIALKECTDSVWHGYLPSVGPGRCYGYRVQGEFNPQKGLRFNPHKLLLDPYAKALCGEFIWHASHYGYAIDDDQDDLSFCTLDNAAYMPKAVVTDPHAVMAKKLKAPIPWPQTRIYEAHPRGLAIRHPAVPEHQQGSIAGLSHPDIIEHLKSLGITSIELLPMHYHVDEAFLDKKGLKNYWGYNSLGFFSAHPAYLPQGEQASMVEMVNAYHDAGIEVLLDVVFNHTAEGGELGPTLSFRGIDNQSYYRLNPQEPRYYCNDTGCGNTLNIANPRVLQLVMDSLRYWVSHYGIDGFRFDLAPVLGRTDTGFDPQAAFFQAIAQDPVLQGIKLIAEPWDIGPGGYQLGQFPARFSEWNDRYRDTVRQYWLGTPGQLPEFARRLHGSSDFFEHHGRKPYASINFITSHDGFTLRDLVSYNDRHNEDNLEDNRDGHGTNYNYNYGHEGPSDDVEIDALRWRQQRNYLATLFVSQGIPMLLGGDEFGRSQQGNNNAYCQDNEINWLDWESRCENALNLQRFTQQMLKIRQCFPLLNADVYRHDRNDQVDTETVQWLGKSGQLMTEDQWKDSDNRIVGYLLTDNSEVRNKSAMIVLFNASQERVDFQLPVPVESPWYQIMDTQETQYSSEITLKAAGNDVSTALLSRSLQIFISGEIPSGLISETR